MFGAVTWTSTTDALCVVNAKDKKKEKELEERSGDGGGLTRGRQRGGSWSRPWRPGTGFLHAFP